MSVRFFIPWLLLSLCNCAETPPSKQPEAPAPIVHLSQDESHTSHHKVRSGTTLSQTLRAAKITHSDSLRFLDEIRKFIDMRKIPTGTDIAIVWKSPSMNHPIGLRLALSKTKEIHVDWAKGPLNRWFSHIQTKEISKRSRAFFGNVKSNLWESAKDSGLDPRLIMELTEIFAWQIDFNREVRQGDRWRLVVNELSVEGEIIGWEPITAAEYATKKERLQAVRFTPSDKSPSYFFEDGQSLRRMFLKSPIRFGRITSEFNRKRFHPILKK